MKGAPGAGERDGINKRGVLGSARLQATQPGEPPKSLCLWSDKTIHLIILFLFVSACLRGIASLFSCILLCVHLKWKFINRVCQIPLRSTRPLSHRLCTSTASITEMLQRSFSEMDTCEMKSLSLSSANSFQWYCDLEWTMCVWPHAYCSSLSRSMCMWSSHTGVFCAFSVCVPYRLASDPAVNQKSIGLSLYSDS